MAVRPSKGVEMTVRAPLLLFVVLCGCGEPDELIEGESLPREHPVLNSPDVRLLREKPHVQAYRVDPRPAKVGELEEYAGFSLIDGPQPVSAAQIQQLVAVLLDAESYIDPVPGDLVAYELAPEVVFEFTGPADTLLAYAILRPDPARWAFAPRRDWIRTTNRKYGKRGVVQHRTRLAVMSIALELFPEDSLLVEIGR
jgi:hypothetical protein